MRFGVGLAALAALGAGTLCGQPYEDGRPFTEKRMAAKDHGVVLRHGGGPKQCDIYGARDVWVFEHGGRYFMHYDAAGPAAWLSALATSKNLKHWSKKGPVLELGKPGEGDSKSASYGVTYFDGTVWHMFYLGTPNTTPEPDRIPGFPYLTMKATAQGPAGPWVKQPEVTPWRLIPGTYNSVTGSPGFIVKQGGEYLQFFSAATTDPDGSHTRRTIGIARTNDLNGAWRLDPEPALPLSEQIENTSLYFEPANQTWFLFTNHVGIRNGEEYTDAVWVYWSKDLNHWDSEAKAVVLDSRNCKWSKGAIGLPSVIKVGKRLAVFYDGVADGSITHMRRDVGLAWLKLPLEPPQ
jgi:predicted GH43/DUF377 family glycosyl hydrolase